jgi:hypothetical protein
MCSRDVNTTLPIATMPSLRMASHEIDTVFVSAVEQRAAAIIGDDAYFESQRLQIAALSLRHRMPSMAAIVGRTSACPPQLRDCHAASPAAEDMR